MSASGQSAIRPAESQPMTLPVLLALAALALGIGAFALRGFDQNGLRLGAQTIWRLGGLVLFAALIARPAGALLPAVADEGRPLLQGFCAVMGVFFGFLLVPAIFTIPDGVQTQGVTAGMVVFILFTGAVTLVLAASVNRGLCASVGEKACRAMLAIAVVFFWLCHVLIALARLSGQGEESLFHQAILVLLPGALLARWVARRAAARRV